MYVADMDHSAATAAASETNQGVDRQTASGHGRPQPGLSPQQAGWFHYSPAENRWEWSAAVARLHGYAPGEVTPDGPLVTSHQHPHDRQKVADTFDQIRRTTQALSSRHRIVDAHGRTRHVIVIGEPVHSEAGSVTGVRGFYVETSRPRDAAREQSVTAAVTEIAEARAGIEQAKGMLMAVYRIDADAAFELLKWRSQSTNTKLRALCERITTDFLAMDTREGLFDRRTYDDLLLTAHQRVESDS